MKYYLTIEKNEIFPFSTTWINLVGSILGEMSLTKKNAVGFHLYVKSKKQNKADKHNKTEAQS